MTYPSRVSPTAVHRTGRAFARVENAQSLLRELREDLQVVGQTSHLGAMTATVAVVRAAERELHVLRDHLISIVETFAREDAGRPFVEDVVGPAGCACGGRLHAEHR